MRFRVLLITILAAGVASAQPGVGGAGRSGGHGGDDVGMGIPVGRPPVKNHMDQISDTLGLSKDQKKNIKALMDEAQKEAAPLRDQLVKGRAQIAVAVQGGKPDEIDSAVKSYSESEAQMAGIEMKTFITLYKGLNEDQKKKWRPVFLMMPGIFTHKNWVDVEQP